MEITKESLKESDFDTMLNLLQTLAAADWRLFMKFLVSQGYDLWLTKAHYPSHEASCMPKLLDISCETSIIAKVKRIIERDYCEETKVVLTLQPDQIRFLHQI